MSEPATIGSYQLLKFIGYGSFATVWIGQHVVTGIRVAIKVISREVLITADTMMRFNREIALLKQLDHPFIAQLFEVLEDDQKEGFYLVLENVEGGSLLDLINKEKRLNENTARKYFCQIVSALNYLHNTKMICHRDLKPENILIDKYDNIKLIDFGFSNCFSKEYPNLTTACGSPAYAAPEMIKNLPYTKAADIWSIGIILYAMVAGTLPFDDNDIQTLLHNVVFGEIIYPSYMSRSLVDLLKRLLIKDPNNRLTIAQILSHPWLSCSKYSALIDNNFFKSFPSITSYSSSPSMPSFLFDTAQNGKLALSASSSFGSLVSDQEVSSSSTENSRVESPLIPMTPALTVETAKETQIENDISNSPIVDKSISESMALMGIDVSSLSHCLLLGEFNPTTAIYKQLKRSKTNDQINIIMKRIESDPNYSNGAFSSEKEASFSQRTPLQYLTSKNVSLMPLALRRGSYQQQTSPIQNVIGLPVRRLSRPNVRRKHVMSPQNPVFNNQVVPPDGLFQNPSSNSMMSPPPNYSNLPSPIEFVKQ